MADAQVAHNKLAMSHALGEALLNYQVSQLEKSVKDSGNWRGRRSPDNRRSGEGRRNYSAPKTIKKRNEGLWEDRAEQADGQVAGREHERRSEDGGKTPKVADVVIVDASVLIYGLYHLKKWCREGNEEIIIIPLEALNTLDLLKKGTTMLAQRARTASRILEAQVGTNSRIRVQSDDAFVLWDEIPFDEPYATALSASPEWVRRIICCARWELEHAAEEDDKTFKPRVVLAILSPSADTQLDTANPAPISTSPVPLPAPQPNKYEARLSSALVARWAAKAGVEVMEVSAAAPPLNPGNGAGEVPKGRRSGDGMRRSGEEERAKRTPAVRGHRNPRGAVPGGRLPQMSTGTGLVERPPAVKTMMEKFTQPNCVVRVLARGEKLEP